ncbi:outer membrane protein assembly factor BamB family protein [Aureliella helgolandensis]|uniref:Pyrrolo-quinoline quinone repeat domain-containing protein n=1 Tax=Aureliella helgolandensis TaxID=2527968 RepID=A0A518GG76_9BACT|nr:PQQ-binding-like beta-propeller repeat protein [Aureliella helgolandensis]QDV27601.1 hypothetical protein Q31a_59930 [Aureliella helgolandensis]
MMMFKQPSWSLSFTDLGIRTRGQIIAVACPLFLILAINSRTSAQDWPQILGPHRDGTAPSTSVLKGPWPAKIAPTWTAALGTGLGGPAVAGDSVLILHRLENEEFLQSFDLNTGAARWKTGWPASYRASINPDNGPRCVPTIAGDRVICYGAAGDLACVGLVDGKLHWRRSLRQEYDAEDGYFGAGVSPLVMGSLVIACPGGDRAGIVGIDLQTGKTRWTATEYEASYAAPIAVPHASRQLALVITRLNTVLLDAQSGEVLSDVRFGSRGPTVNAATPSPIGDDQFFLTASYGVGAMLLQVRDEQLVEIYRDKFLLSSQYNTPVHIGSRMIGIDGREDAGIANLRAFDPQSQEIFWRQDDFGTAHLIACGSEALALGLSGRLTRIDGQSDAFHPLSESQLPTAEYRALPALSGNKLLIRGSLGNATQLHCIELP